MRLFILPYIPEPTEEKIRLAYTEEDNTTNYCSWIAEICATITRSCATCLASFTPDNTDEIREYTRDLSKC